MWKSPIGLWRGQKLRQYHVLLLIIVSVNDRQCAANENITMLEAIETACSHAFIPQTDDAMTIGNVQAYLHQLQDAVTDEVYTQRYHPAEQAVLASLDDDELEALRCDIENEQQRRIEAQFGCEPEINEPPFTDAVDDQDGASELPPLVPEDRL